MNDILSSRFKEQLASATKGRITPVPLQFTNVEVKVSLDTVGFSTWFDEYVFTVNATLQVEGGILPTFNAEDFKRYLNTILYSRVLYVQSRPGVHPVLQWRDEFLVPAFFCGALAQIGVAIDHNLGIQLTPVYDGPTDNLMTKEEVLNFSRNLKILERFGFHFGVGYYRDKQGEFLTLAFNLVESQVMHPFPQAPESMAVVAAFFGFAGIQQVLNPIIRYADLGMLSSVIRSLVRPER